MKKLSVTLVAVVFATSLFGQVSGNVNYQNMSYPDQKQIIYPDNNIEVGFLSDNSLYLSVKGMANVKADTYVAIFNVTQTGTTTEEVNRLIDERIKKAIDQIKTKEGVKTYVDMISFVPMYEYEVEKKVFSKKTYNEIPSGFEIKKNIHVEFANPDLLNEIITDFSTAEIYDLVRVDYFSKEMESIKKELMTKAKIVLKEKLNNYQEILSINLDSMDKQVTDGYKVVLPVEMYKSYQAYASSALNRSKNSHVNYATKATTMYYQPIIDKEFDFVINPTILEPVIQVMYQIRLRINKDDDKLKKASKEYILVTPNGDLRKLDLNK